MGSTSLELCSGDIYIAKWAHSVGLGYIGFDVNYRFVRYAVKRGFDVRLVDLNKVKQFPDASIAVMMGSLYHFHYNLKDFVDRVMASVKRFIISEPIRNLSQTAGILGWIAQRSANVGKGNESFRCDESGLIEALIKVCGDVYLCKVLMRDRKDIIIEILWK